MAANKQINIAVILSAYDKMSAVVNQVVNATTAKLNQLQKYSDKVAQKSITSGRQSMTTGAIVATPLIAAAKAYADQEEAALRMRTAMMQDGGRVNEQQYNNLVKFATKTSEQLTGSTADYLKMVKVLQENSIKPEEILGGIGEATAKLAVFFKMDPADIGQFAARMKQDMGVAPKEMTAMMDVIARLNNAGVGKDGAEAVNEMGEAFSKAGLGAHNLGVIGLQASKDLGALMGIFIRRGISGGTVGTNFRRIFDGLRDAEKLKKANEVAKEYGITLDFYTKDHKFKGIANLTGELNKLKGLSTTQISAVLKPFSGKQGLSTDFLEFLGKEGTESFNTMQEKLAKQATLAAKVKVMMGGLSNEFNRTKTTALNAAAAFGSTYAPELKHLINNFNILFSRISNFINTHKTLVANVAKGIAYFAAFKLVTGGLLLVFGEVLKTGSQLISGIKNIGLIVKFLTPGIARLGAVFIETVIPAMISFTATVWANAAAWLANPATYIILAIVAAVAALIAIGYVVYKNWDKIISWFSDKWVIMKAGVAGMIGIFGLFSDVLIGVGKAIYGAFTFDPTLMISGAKQAATAVSKIANGGIIQAFNQGANGSLKASGAYINANGDVIRTNTTPIRPVNTPGTGNVVHNHFSPNITVAAGATGAKDGHVIASTLKPHFDSWMKDHEAKQKRISYNH